MNWIDILTRLIRRTTSDLPADVEGALRAALAAEPAGSQAAVTLGAIAENTRLAREQGTPLCQDTGTLTFFWRVPRGTDTFELEQAAREAVRAASAEGLLRANTIESLTGRSVDANVAEGCPVCHFEQVSPVSDLRSFEVWLLQKGGGCENMSAQYSLPCDIEGRRYGRDLDGVRACVLHAVCRAQGLGCAPGILGVCVGGDRAEGYLEAKRQLLRPLPDASPERELAALERRLLADANALGIGPMGLGGRATLLGVKAAARTRLPASYFVTVAYMCWACRRRGVRVSGETVEWLG